MTRLEALDKLCDGYSAYFDIVRYDETDGELNCSNLCGQYKNRHYGR